MKKESSRKGGIQKTMYAGKDGCQKGGIKERRDSESNVCRKGGMPDTRDSVKGGMQGRTNKCTNFTLSVWS